MTFYQRHGVVRAVQWNVIGDHPAVAPGVHRGAGILDIRVAKAYARRHVEPGDWIVIDGDGKCSVVTDAEFTSNYKGV